MMWKMILESVCMNRLLGPREDAAVSAASVCTDPLFYSGLGSYIPAVFEKVDSRKWMAVLEVSLLALHL